MPVTPNGYVAGNQEAVNGLAGLLFGEIRHWSTLQ